MNRKDVMAYTEKRLKSDSTEPEIELVHVEASIAHWRHMKRPEVWGLLVTEVENMPVDQQIGPSGKNCACCMYYLYGGNDRKKKTCPLSEEPCRGICNRHWSTASNARRNDNRNLFLKSADEILEKLELYAKDLRCRVQEPKEKVESNREFTGSLSDYFDKYKHLKCGAFIQANMIEVNQIYILCKEETSGGMGVCLHALRDGNRWSDAIRVSKAGYATEDEVKKMTGPIQFRDARLVPLRTVRDYLQTLEEQRHTRSSKEPVDPGRLDEFFKRNNQIDLGTFLELDTTDKSDRIYLLARGSNETAILVSIKDGGRWTTPVEADIGSLDKDQMIKAIGYKSLSQARILTNKDLLFYFNRLVMENSSCQK